MRKIRYILLSLCLVSSLSAQQLFSSMAAALGMELTRTYGISVVDYNNDGLDDVYIAMRLGRNKLFKNLFADF